MANWCYLNCEVKFKDRKTLLAAMTFMKLDWAKTREGHGHDMNMDDNWFFNLYLPETNEKGEFCPSGNILYIQGDVRWALQHKQAEGLVKWFLKKGAEHDMVFYYDESTEYVFGKYTYQDGVLIDYCVPYEHEFWEDQRNENEDERKYDGVDSIPVESLSVVKIEIDTKEN